MSRFLVVAFSAVVLGGCFSQPPAPSVDRVSAPQASRQSAAAQPAGPGYYTVKRGDTLYRIAMEHGQDYRDLANWNGLSNPSAIKEGQVLRVSPPGSQPAGDGTAQTTPINGGGGIEVRSLDAGPASSQTPSPSPVNAVGGLIKREPRVGKMPYSDEAYNRLNRSETPASAPAAPPADSAPAAAPAAPAAAPSSPAALGPDEVSWLWPTNGKLISPFSESGNKGLDLAGKAGDPVLAAGDGKVVYAGSGLRGYGELVIVKHNSVYLSAYAHNRKVLVKEGQQVTRGQKIAEMGNTDADSVKLHFEIRKQGKPVDPAQFLPRR